MPSALGFRFPIRDNGAAKPSIVSVNTGPNTGLNAKGVVDEPSDGAAG